MKKNKTIINDTLRVFDDEDTMLDLRLARMRYVRLLLTCLPDLFLLSPIFVSGLFVVVHNRS